MFFSGIENLRFIFVKSNEVTIAWTTIMNYSNQSVSYKPLDGDVFYKSLPFDGKSEHSERIVKLKPCTMYTIMVEMVNECNPPPKSINITTHDEGKIGLIALNLCHSKIRLLVFREAFFECVVKLGNSAPFI